MSVAEGVLVASVASGVPASVLWLAYRDYLKGHRAFLAVVREMHEADPSTAETLSALAPAPPALHLHRRAPTVR